MNVAEANQIVSGLNYIAELMTALAADVEKAAWEGFEDHAGMSPVNVRWRPLSWPSLRSRVTGRRSRNPSRMKPSAQISLEQVRGKLATLSGKGLTPKVRELILAAGASKLSDVDPSKYSWLLAQAEELDYA